MSKGIVMVNLKVLRAWLGIMLFWITVLTCYSQDKVMPQSEQGEQKMFMNQPTIAPEDAEYLPYKMESMGVGSFGLLLFDQMEYRLNDGSDLLSWDVEGRYGGNVNRFWFKTEGEQSLQDDSNGNAEIHGYYSRMIAPFWDAQVGLRYDPIWQSGKTSSRYFAALGLQGFAPYSYEVTPVIFISENGEVSARLTASKDFLFTQRLIAQARVETEVAAQAVPEFGVGSGFNYVELGLRLRYEIRREFAPYVGVNWERKLGQTSSLARKEGDGIDSVSVVAGLRLWF